MFLHIEELLPLTIEEIAEGLMQWEYNCALSACHSHQILTSFLLSC